MATAPAYRRELDPPAPAADPSEAFRLTHEEPTPEEIAAEAYAIYIAQGREDGRDIDHWLEAERALRTSERRESSSRR